MARYKLVEYLNDPSLLLSTSMEELNSWAEEAPYSGLIRRLIAQKLTIENSSDGVKQKANALAIISDANPELTIASIEDFKRLILEQDEHHYQEKSASVIEDPLKAKEESAIQSEKAVDDGGDSPSEDPPVSISSDEITEEVVEFETLKEVIHIEPVKVEKVVNKKNHSEVDLDDQDSKESGFYSWLSSLKSLEESKTDTSHIELEDKELASEGLAELLVRQGHYESAIDMYELLKLKNPEKSSFFAAQIETLKAL